MCVALLSMTTSDHGTIFGDHVLISRHVSTGVHPRQIYQTPILTVLRMGPLQYYVHDNG
jgi:hypothetical protein